MLLGAVSEPVVEPVAVALRVAVLYRCGCCARRLYPDHPDHRDHFDHHGHNGCPDRLYHLGHLGHHGRLDLEPIARAVARVGV